MKQTVEGALSAMLAEQARLTRALLDAAPPTADEWAARRAAQSPASRQHFASVRGQRAMRKLGYR